MQEHIDSCHKESESHAAYSEHSSAHFNNVANIPIHSDSITPQKNKNGREEKSQKDHDIPLKKKANKNTNDYQRT